tara:strand:+ start:395 stop:592 length:198 start_codon:yes stop_codon:yes gene_type:complete
MLIMGEMEEVPWRECWFFGVFLPESGVRTSVKFCGCLKVLEEGVIICCLLSYSMKSEEHSASWEF